jgi:hypothetical protein
VNYQHVKLLSLGLILNSADYDCAVLERADLPSYLELEASCFPMWEVTKFMMSAKRFKSNWAMVCLATLIVSMATAPAVQAALRRQGAGKAIEALADAAADGNVAAMRKAIAQGANVNGTNSVGATPLWLAARNGSSEAVTELLNCHVNINCQNKDGATALWAAVQSGEDDMVKLLLAHGIDPNRPTNGGGTPLMLVCSGAGAHMPDKTRLKIIKMLIAAHADVNAHTKDGKISVLSEAKSNTDLRAQMLPLLRQAGAK